MSQPAPQPTPPSDPFAHIPLVTPLNAAQMQSVGVPEGWHYGLADRVRFHELDALNHVNNVAYFRWFESIRIPFFAHYHVSTYSDGDPQVVLATNYARYFKPMHLGDNYVITARCKSFRNTSFVMEYGVFVEGSLMCGSESVIVTLEQDGVTKRALRPETVAGFLRDGAIQG
ncbi:acyl-CoA thioesterase [Aliiroseovarius crassostreae]|uniref:acyl-CoA thioesterase n=1 Tax=Aliiroseovarius crassostreae TaxID=154981 RepID=UPI002208E872|nr:acyl-CoA thioesterase [Aliiroseovarius crassostreae]UWP99622.1 acyl-CoA thioesterase [Aliiroseovarius crassostreae]